MSQSPQTGQFNSYLTLIEGIEKFGLLSQSPQTGQFNSYLVRIDPKTKSETQGLNPLKRVNSILTLREGI